MRAVLHYFWIGLVLLSPKLVIGQVYTEDFSGGIPANWVTYTEAGFDFVYSNSGLALMFKQSEGGEILLLGTEELDLSQYTKMEVSMAAFNLAFGSDTKPYIHMGILWDQNDISSFEPIKIEHVTNEVHEVFDIFLGAYNGMGHIAFKMVGEKSQITELDDFKLYDDDFEANFPLAVSNFSATPAPMGGLSLSVDWTNPTHEADGDVLQSLDSVVFLIDNIPVHTELNPVIGASESTTISVDSAYYYKITAVPYSNGNAGYSKETDTYWVGLDFPAEIHDLSIELNGDQVTLTWSPPTAGSNGGYYDGVVTEYFITRCDGNFTSISGTETTFTETLDAMGTLNYVVQARNPSGVGDPLTSGKIYYVSDDYLYYEDFWVDMVHTPGEPPSTEPFEWQTDESPIGGYWTWFGSDFTVTDPGELSFVWAFQNPNNTGTIRAISPIINTIGADNVTIQLNAYIEAGNNPFSFVIETTSDGGQTWNQVHEWEINSEPVNEETSKVIANSDVGSTNFQFAVTFVGNPFYTGFTRFDNVRVFNQPSTDILVESFGELGTVEPTTTIPLVADIENNSTSIVDCTVKCTVKERFGTGIPFELEVAADNMAIGEIRTIDFGTWDAEEGEYLVEVEVIYPGGDDDPNNDLEVRELNVLYLSDRNFVLMEDFTGTWCAYCPGAALGIEDLIIGGYPIAPIGWHRNDPYETPDVQDRMDQYSVEGFPTMVIDGVIKYAGGHQTQSIAAVYIPFVNERSAKQTPAQIDIIQAELDGDMYTATADITSLSVIQNPNYQLRAVITESEIEDEWLGIPTVDEAQRYYSEHSIDLSDKNDQVSVSFQIDNFVNTDHTELVLYVQDITTNEVMNATMLDLNTTITSTFENKPKGKVSLFPNPASDRLTIDIKEVDFKGDATLRILNSFGQSNYEKINYIDGQFDQLSVDLSSWSAGIYIVTLDFGDGKLFTERLVIVR